MKTNIKTAVGTIAIGVFVVLLTTFVGGNFAAVDVSASNFLSIDAGPDKTVAFPAKDVSLFGHYSSDNNNLVIQWTQLSGPATATFSAPWALATDVTFSTAGVYIFQLSVTDGPSTFTDTMTVNVLSSASQTAFYVDPTYTGGSNDGSAAHPWTTIHSSTAGSAPWNMINNALASNNVVVYFSARQTGSDISESDSQSLEIWRTDTSSHRLTLDGMSKYNTNDTFGSWLDYTGSNKFKFAITSGSVGVGVQGSNPAYPANYTTIRGFEVTSNGATARVLPTGNYSVLEYMWVHDITNIGATIQFAQPVHSYPDCTKEFGNEHDITIRNNLIENGFGEGIYLAGTYFTTTGGGCLDWGQTHSDILIEGNTIRNPGANGGQGDDIDLKAGLLRVTVRGNDLEGPGGAGTRGIVATGIFPNLDGTFADQAGYLIENNYIHDRNYRCIDLYNLNYTIVRNNICANTLNSGIGVGDGSGVHYPYTKSDHISIYNNTLSNVEGSIGVSDTLNAVLRNNLIANLNTGQIQLAKSFSAPPSDSDYNILVTGATLTSGWIEGSHSIYYPNGTNFFIDSVNGNFHLNGSSMAVDVGANLSSNGFSIDKDSTSRPQGPTWDIGAYEYCTSNCNSPPPLPTQYTLTATKLGTGSGTITSNPTGINCGSTCSHPFNDGTNVTLNATADADSTFTGWSGACSGTDTCTITMDSEQSVTATFTQNSSGGGGGGGSHSGGGGGGGGSSGGTTTPPPVVVPPGTLPPGCNPGDNFSALTGQPCTGTLPPTYVPPSSFTRDLTLGSTGSDVTALQNILISLGYLIIPQGVPQGYFGNLTQSALIQYQLGHNIQPAAGYFGPITRGVIGGVTPGPIPLIVPPPSTTPPPTKYTFTIPTNPGESNQDVLPLQQFLTSHGFLTGTYTPGVYDPTTVQALGQFQIATGIFTSPTQDGYGLVGPLTRSRLNQTP